MKDRPLERYTVACLVLDFLGVVGALALAAVLRFTLPIGRQLIPGYDYLSWALFPLALLCWALAAGQFRLYEWHWRLNLRREFGRLLLAVGGMATLLASALYLTFRDVPRGLFGYFVLLALGCNFLGRVAVRAFFRARFGDRAAINILIVGGGRVAASLAGRLAAVVGGWPPTRVLGVVTDGEAEASGLPLLGPLADLEAIIERTGATTVVSTLPSSAHEQTIALAERLQGLPVDLRVVPDVLDLAYARATITDLEGIPLVGLRDPALSPSGKLVKYGFDRLVSLVGLVVGLPFFLLVALLIRLDSPGPIIYGARRVGEDGRPFTMYKFRTMTVGADRALAAAVAGIEPRALRKESFKSPGDARITRVGRFLRRTSIDELPNLWNVLRGEMSIVGPRPEQPFIVEGYEPWQHRRTHMRPGMTGWWQVNGRSERPMHQHTDFDLYYLENYSLLLDLRILGRTVGAVITGRGAY